MFLRNYWYVAAMPQELENGALLGRWILDNLSSSTVSLTAKLLRCAISARTARRGIGRRTRRRYSALPLSRPGVGPSCLRVPAGRHSTNRLRVQSRLRKNGGDLDHGWAPPSARMKT